MATMDWLPYDQTETLNLSQNGILDMARVHKLAFRRTVDYNASIMYDLSHLNSSRYAWNRDFLQPCYLQQEQVLPPYSYAHNIYTSITTKHVRTCTNKNKCPVYCVCVGSIFPYKYISNYIPRYYLIMNCFPLIN